MNLLNCFIRWLAIESLESKILDSVNQSNLDFWFRDKSNCLNQVFWFIESLSPKTPKAICYNFLFLHFFINVIHYLLNINVHLCSISNKGLSSSELTKSTSAFLWCFFRYFLYKYFIVFNYLTISNEYIICLMYHWYYWIDGIYYIKLDHFLKSIEIDFKIFLRVTLK